MAMRASGGTGVLVALIIFIFLTVGCAAAAILLYGQKNSVIEDAQRARQDLEDIMTRTPSRQCWDHSRPAEPRRLYLYFAKNRTG